jgi:hypothetical protein
VKTRKSYHLDASRSKIVEAWTTTISPTSGQFVISSLHPIVAYLPDQWGDKRSTIEDFFWGTVAIILAPR